jgi:hypothetical protein
VKQALGTAGMSAVNVNHFVVPTTARVRAGFNANDRLACEMTPLTTVACGATEITIHRHDWPNDDSVLSATVTVSGAAEGGEVFLGADDAVDIWLQLVELANSAEAAAKELRTLITNGWAHHD